MGKKFNVTGLCVPTKHYMVNISRKVDQMVQMVNQGDYFVMNRARQYGKTTTLLALKKQLQNKYETISISFEGLGDSNTETEVAFCQSFLLLVYDSLEFSNANEDFRSQWQDTSVTDFLALSRFITKVCRRFDCVLIIDEVDKVSNNKVFLNFLSTLRKKYLASQAESDFTFKSVILAGVYDIKNIKLKLIESGFHHKKDGEIINYNSPWNIAVDFRIDMAFDANGISEMLTEYKNANQENISIQKMDTEKIAETIYIYSKGYPYLVSRICLLIDTEMDKDWTPKGVQKAIQIMLTESTTLFDDLNKNLQNDKDLYDLLYDLLIIGNPISYNIDNPTIAKGLRYGYIIPEEELVKISNPIFEIRICNYFISRDETKTAGRPAGVLREDVLKNGHLNMELILTKFSLHFQEIRNSSDLDFLEKHGRLLFLTFLKPLLNGQGFYHIESAFTDSRRMDIVVDFGNEQFVIELKLWYGEQAHQKAYAQLSDYLSSKSLKKGYLLTFDFRKDKNREIKSEWLSIGNFDIFDVIV